MTERIDRADWPTPRGPWHEVTDLTRLYDRGRPWCVNAAAHPGEDGYPDVEKHRPWRECRGVELPLDGAHLGVDGEAIDVSVYLAAPFRYGQLRGPIAHAPSRVVIEAWRAAADDSTRISIGLAEALRLARLMNHLVDKASILPA